jgi:hypothetical protein
MKAKPEVWYDNFTYESGDETHQIKQKLTRIAVLKGEEAKAVNMARKNGFVMTYSGTKGKERLDFYKASENSLNFVKLGKNSASKQGVLMDLSWFLICLVLSGTAGCSILTIILF